MGGHLWLSSRPGWEPLGLLLPPSASHRSRAQKQRVVLTLGLPMTHLKQRQGCCPSLRGPKGAGAGRRQGRP